jgi:hypothetical protein
MTAIERKCPQIDASKPKPMRLTVAEGCQNHANEPITLFSANSVTCTMCSMAVDIIRSQMSQTLPHIKEYIAGHMCATRPTVTKHKKHG